jgi:AcrR family transcriptional regulator
VRRHLLTIDEIAKVFREELTRRHRHPSKAQLAVLLLNLSGPIAQLDLEAFAALSPICRAAADFSHHGWHTYQAIKTIAAIRPDWLAEIPILARIRKALQEAVEQGLLEPMPPEQIRGSGRRSLHELHLSAYFVARAVQRCLQEANPLQKVSLSSESGPVLRVGAKLIARLRGQHVVQPTTFRSQILNGATLAAKPERNLVRNSSR